MYHTFHVLCKLSMFFFMLALFITLYHLMHIEQSHMYYLLLKSIIHTRTKYEYISDIYIYTDFMY